MNEKIQTLLNDEEQRHEKARKLLQELEQKYALFEIAGKDVKEIINKLIKECHYPEEELNKFLEKNMLLKTSRKPRRKTRTSTEHKNTSLPENTTPNTTQTPYINTPNIEYNHHNPL